MSRTPSTARRRSRSTATALGLTGLLALAACSAPGQSTSEEPSASAGASDAATTPGEVPGCGEDAVVVDAYVETGFPLFRELADEFTAQFPNVTFDIREDQFAVLTQNAPRVLADDPPDLMRLPQMSELASDGLLLNLDPYAEAFGWDEWPSSQLEQMRVDDEGRRGSGPLYAMGMNFSMTGVFYNKALAEEIGMTEAPATLEELDGYMQAAVDAGITPSAQFNGGATGGLAFPLQMLMASYGDPSEVNAWVYQQEGATIDTPSNLQAAEHLERWIEAGYFADDVNSLDYSQSMARFLEGDNLFFFNGDWESGTFDTQVPGEVGFFLMPPVEEGGSVGAMSAPLTYGIGAGAENADCAASFLNWIATDEEARTIAVEVGGSHPMGPVDAFMPEIDESSVTAQTLAAGVTIGEDNGSMDFIANATGGIYAKGWTPNLQKLVAGQIEAADLLPAVQAEYENEIG
ncbi:carbohydrate ABC transporter substrate-binding protein, CUT1 family [Georgenia satyanarayanai]|uniref:Carbohydrate ABC transporter substrate-binding protein, CUT1 family n=1 Tax=Georgenia satyanarayanai TaxID=860221 RepID=A0A2Y9C2U8_9MICO|nr:extracellular solute-binding protein [Georgenia satyanarayanai]PYG01910.1 carbohydrate ABC transporter substrate-binding protein (CUT1 family) [Georgenia satyanarayanai]SSA36713.1 carbohydrate ABC transporter substrate-binding protein, CUT1 family [Georgenia satyanarayanai]